MSKPVRHFLDINELPLGELRNMLSAGAAMKAKLKAHEKGRKPLEGKTLAMIFERPSTRTRVSFDVGMRQLGGEKIDIIDFSEDPTVYVGNALAPSKVVKVTVVDNEAQIARVVVPDYQLSLAIGKEGQNARLAARLTGWKIDIHSDADAN